MCGRARACRCRVSSPKNARRVCSAITNSSSEALPARSPMPLIVHSDLPRAGAHAGQRVGDGQAEVVVAVRRDRHALGAGHVARGCRRSARRIRRAWRSRLCPGCSASSRQPRSPLPAPRRGTRDRTAPRPPPRTRRRRRCAQARRHRRGRRSTTCGRVMRSLCSRWMSEVARKMWMRGTDRRLDRLPAAIDVARTGARQPADRGSVGAAISSAQWRAPLAKSPVRSRREAGLDDIDPQARQLPRDVELLVERHRAAGRLLAIAQRRVEDTHVDRRARLPPPAIPPSCARRPRYYFPGIHERHHPPQRRPTSSIC